MKLFEPGKIGKLTVKNRIGMAPMGLGSLYEPDGTLSQRAIDYYLARVQGGVGLIVCTGAARGKGEAHVSASGQGGDGAALKKLADAAHSYGVKVALQMGAGLGRVGAPRPDGKAGYVMEKSDLFGPSAIPSFWDPNTLVRELTFEEIQQLVESFKRPAEIARNAGIDAIWLHGHSGYTFDMFTTALWNKRKDKYGGDLEGRLRFPIEVIQAIKKAAGDDFPVIYRYGVTHYLAGGREVDEGLEMARRLEAAGVDGLDVDAGCYETHYWTHPSSYSSPGTIVPLSAKVKKVVGIPVMVVGKLGFPDLAERVLQEGKADFIMIAKALLADPEWPNKVRENRPEDIRPCIGDFECLARNRSKEYLSCSVNPATGREKEFAIGRARKKKSVLIIGGGPGGMEAARVAALRGHKVTLWEKGNALGGNLIPGSVPDFKQDYRHLINYLSTQIQKLGVRIETEKEATPERVRAMKPDAVFVATGAREIVPRIPGIERNNVVPAIDCLSGKKEVGKSVAVLGGGMIGCETALYLAQKGKKVTVVARHEAAGDMYWAIRMHLMKLLDDADVKILTCTKTLKILDRGLAIADKDGKKGTLEADNIVLAAGLKPNRELLEALKGTGLDVYAIGDCIKPGRVMNAMWRAFRVARRV